MCRESLGFIPLFGLQLVFSEQLENVYEVCAWRAGKEGNKNALLSGSTSVLGTLLDLHIKHCHDLQHVLKLPSLLSCSYKLKILQLNGFHCFKLVSLFMSGRIFFFLYEKKSMRTMPNRW